MNEDVKMAHIGIWLMVSMIVLTVGLQVCYRTQNKAFARVRAEIAQTQQDIASSQAQFASFVRPEILRNLVVSTSPKTEIISFHKTVRIGEIPLRHLQDQE